APAQRWQHVRYRGNSGQHMLYLRFTAFAPKRTFELGGSNTYVLRLADALPRSGRCPMCHQVISQCTQSLKNLETCHDKAEQHAAAKKFNVGVLMTSRLAPDMQHFIYQVQSACDYVKAAAAWLSGQTPPKHEDTEH